MHRSNDMHRSKTISFGLSNQNWGGKTTPSKIALAMIILLLTSTLLLPAYATFKTSIMTVEPKNISINITGEYNISKNASVAMAAQTININSTNPVGNNASLMLISFYTEVNATSQINSTEFLDNMEAMFLGMYALMGIKEAGNVTVKSSWGQNVTLHTFAMPGPKDKPKDETTFAFWDLNGDIHVIMISNLDRNVSSRIVETLEIKD